MAYNKFTFEKAVADFGLKIEPWENPTFGVSPVEPSDFLKIGLEKHYRLALMIGTEKARSEFIVAPILAEACEQDKQGSSLFSGISFNVDAKSGLTGVCDFLISKSRNQKLLEAPILTIIEAKKGDLDLGLGQCAAEMVACQIFNQRAGRDIPTIYGIVTTGESWKFLRLTDKKLEFQIDSINISRLDLILGFFQKIIA